MTDRSEMGVDSDVVLRRIKDPTLAQVGRKILTGERLDLTDGLACLETCDLSGLGSIALWAKRQRFGNRAFYVVNHHLNYTNVCINRCSFCAFHRTKESPDAYLLSPEQAAEEIRSSAFDGLREVHVVGGINPDTELSYYLDLLKSLGNVKQGLTLKAFTAVEIDHISRKAGLSWSDCLGELRGAGLSALPGGGAEVFSGRVREKLFPNKISADSWLGVHAAAHQVGIGTNATILFGHIETHQERIEHLLRLRAQQDETGGFRAFIPLAFHPHNTGMAHLSGPDGMDVLKMIAVSRLVLDNIPHIKAYWIMLGRKMAQLALHFGADDLEGTIGREKIAHEAGAATSVGLSRNELGRMIVDAGFEPTERDTFHRAVGSL